MPRRFPNRPTSRENGTAITAMPSAREYEGWLSVKRRFGETERGGHENGAKGPHSNPPKRARTRPPKGLVLKMSRSWSRDVGREGQHSNPSLHPVTMNPRYPDHVRKPRKTGPFSGRMAPMFITSQLHCHPPRPEPADCHWIVYVCHSKALPLSTMDLTHGQRCSLKVLQNSDTE